MENALAIQPKSKVAASAEVSIAVHENVVERKKPERAVDIQNVWKDVREFLDRRLVQGMGHRFELLPLLLAGRVCFQLVRTLVVLCLFAKVFQCSFS